MQPASRLGRQIQELLQAFESAGVAVALIGGLALAPYRVVSATRDVDLLVDASLGDTVDDILTSLGYRCLHRSVDAANYLRGDERVDFLYAHRPVARELLGSARQRQTPFGNLRIISLEGLIAFKTTADQGRNDPVLVAEGGLPGPPSRATDPFADLDDLMVVIEALCPVWPERPLTGPMNDMRL